ncbi:MAG: peptidoglycan DD-metalloendopeptidase family protein [Clostridium sp.]|uniref:murein hydrolase activator EnvC family protein n=1 Tax=Clostridium culturomicium TaxID=1499683 RepID=UPI000694104C|nr:peptidoglycan DD-metalloendopeptidase family protein [Clostridium culturomicium]MDU4892175.1 peptidoglycan DD-metalloendopeptidase family protein [Clostridium sp.]MDU7082562.1 peptidoglycan DD-metalloendopeptidase family protein [Clostridium sp.]
MNKRIKVLISVLMCTSLFSATVFADDLSDKKQQSSDVEAEIDAGKARVNELESKKDTVTREVEALNSEAEALNKEINELNSKIEVSNKNLEELKVKTEELTKAIEDNQHVVNERMRTLYKSQGQSYIEILLESQGITDMLKRIDYLMRMIKFDKEVMEEFEKNQRELASVTKEAEEEKAKLQDDKMVVEVKTNELNAKTAAKNALVAGLEADIAAEEAKIAQMEAEFNELLSAINTMEAEAVQDERPSRGDAGSTTAGNGDIFSITGGMAYPITSTFDPRPNPITGVWESHGALDLGAPHGAGVFALKAGTVAYSGWMSGYGNVVVINHGDMSTLYAHNSVLNVSAGEQVSGGQRIASVGSTGNSTGPHIHFEVIIGGVKVDPAPYYIY